MIDQVQAKKGEKGFFPTEESTKHRNRVAQNISHENLVPRKSKMKHT